MSGRFTDAAYRNDTYNKITAEILNQFDATEHVYLVVADVSSGLIENGNQDNVCGVARSSWYSSDNQLWHRVTGGLVIMPGAGSCFTPGVAAHELGHTFSLVHDYRDDNYVMGFGTYSRLSYCAAEWLSVHPFFTDKIRSNQNTSIEIRLQHGGRFQFQIMDPDGIHQVQFLIPATVRDPSPVGTKLHDCQSLNGSTNSTVTFVVNGFSPVSSDSVTLQVMDHHGNISERKFPIQTVEASNPTVESTRIVGDVNGDGTVNIADLVLVAKLIGETGNTAADVNNDSVVNIADLVLVAGRIGTDGSAPSVLPDVFELLTAGDLQNWLTQAKNLSITDEISQRGMLLLERLLAISTPKETILMANYPNPFNPETWIPYQLAEPANVKVSIYSIDSKLVRTLLLGHQPAGMYIPRSHAVYWDGKNEIGELVASGVYFYTLVAGDFTASRQMLIRK